MNGRFPRGGGEPIWRRIRDFIAEPLQAAAEEQRSYLNSPQGQRFDWRVAIMLVSVAVLLTVQKYAVIDSGGTGWGVQEHLIDWLENSYRGLSPQLDYDDHDRLASLTYWALGNFVLYVLVPAAIIKRLFRERLAEHGAKLRGWHDCWWVYLAMYLIMLPAILLASSWESFQHKYP